MKRLPSGAQRWIDAREVDHRVRAGKTAGPLPQGALVPVKQLEPSIATCCSCSPRDKVARNLGDYLEFGVYAAGSVACMHRATEDLGLSHVRLFGFDSFEGLPSSDERYDGTKWHPGDYAYDEQAARAYLTREAVPWDRVTLIGTERLRPPVVEERHGIVADQRRAELERPKAAKVFLVSRSAGQAGDD